MTPVEFLEKHKHLIPQHDYGQPKEGIEQVGVLNDGRPLYRYRFVGDHGFQLGSLEVGPDDGFHIGVMAQDVQKIYPEAVREIDGYLTVDYKMLTDMMMADGTVRDELA
jgi:hypothetical protein